ncbi:DNA polymerase/3'-5' exonuclease PolX [Alkalicella caledoniensis]|uniref:DNA polymerase/3'-5' exonuclease PolX n=1 Tax=Alkalicella caledoniensis TaxID=2731377 RepID=A0A7G9WAJ5_ALKCA|nr:DNA polymerase/3'-5' exonuclease PolX [Alkalicella caledoniensis]QNO15707.1 DNA polymerase/3'-5' exonuclease PolX [Alkalicella caledoniensis]
MDNREVAWTLLEIGKMVELRGDSKFAGQSYKRAARLIERSEPIKKLIDENKLRNLEGIGDRIAQNIMDMVKLGHSPKLEKLREQVPCGLREMIDIPNLTSQKVHLLYKELNIDTIDKLEKAIASKRLLSVKGFGLSTIGDIKSGIEQYKQRGRTFLLGLALPLAYSYLKEIREMDCVKNAEVVGEIRRMKETVSSVEIIVLTDDTQKFLTTLKKNNIEIDSNKEKRTLEFEGNYNIPVKIYLSPEEKYGIEKIIYTGSEKHVQDLEALGLLKQRSDNEGQVYDSIGLKYIPPFLREGDREIELARDDRLPNLISVKDIVGDLHLHSHYSDGLNSIEELVKAAKRMGYQYIAITDHSQSLKIAKGLTKERILEQWREIDRIQGKYHIKILKGIEVDILADGSLDFQDDFLEQFDIVVASVHSHFKQHQNEMTARIMKAVANPNVDIIGHATGRLIQKRMPYDVDIKKVLNYAKDYKIAFEINSSPDRLDLNSENILLAKELGLKIAINTDSHSTLEFANILLGVGTGQRGYLEKKDVLNCWEKEELLAYLRG